MGRHRLNLTEEEKAERKEKKKQYDVKYQNNRYKIDLEYREKKKLISNRNYHKKRDSE